MRHLHTFPDHPTAQRFSDYLLTVGVGSHVDEDAAGTFSLWVEHDDHLDRARVELSMFEINPTDPKYDAKQIAKKIRSGIEEARRRRAEQHIDVRTGWAKAAMIGATPICYALLGLCVVATITVGTGEGGPQLRDLLMFASLDDFVTSMVEGRSIFAATFSSIMSGDLWRLVTPILMHGDILHLMFNLWMLFEIGRLVEGRKGVVVFGLLVLVSAVLSNLAQASWMALTNLPPTFLGISGVNYALFGFAWMRGKFAPYEQIRLTTYTIWAMMTWFVLCFLPLMPIANAAHAAGLLTGVVAGAWGPIRRKLTRSRTT
jgi:GlpG protein